jgi:hypothetical protein
MAMDYLPVQATSVPSECVFFSVKETDTTKRNWMSPMLMEALQLLKFSLKKERLNFTAGWVTSEDAMVYQPRPTIANALFMNVDDAPDALDNILKEMWDDNGDS